MLRQVILASRVRPFTQREVALRAKSTVLVQGECTTIVNPATGDAKAFVLDFSYDSMDPSSPNYASNRTLFNDLGPVLLQSAWDGYNSCLFVHGQAGSGKTHTLIGEENDQGLIPQLLELLFQTIAKYEEQSDSMDRVIVDCSFCEVHSEVVRDVLTRDYQPGGLKIRQKGDTVFVEALTKMRLNTMSDCEELLAALLSSLPSVTQQAHTIFTVSLTRIPRAAKPSQNNPAVRSKIHFVELASSAVEAGSIPIMPTSKSTTSPQDRALLSWSNVMSALARQQAHFEAMEEINPNINSNGYGSSNNGSKSQRGARPGQSLPPLEHIPYRSSILTRLLQDSMGDRSRCIVLATISPAHICFRETLNTFRHIVRCKETKRSANVRRSAGNQLGPAAIGPNGEADWRFIPAAGGGWRWSYACRSFDDS